MRRLEGGTQRQWVERELGAGVRACGYLPCASISGIKKPRQSAGLVSLRANRVIHVSPVALPIHHPVTVTYEQFCI